MNGIRHQVKEPKWIGSTGEKRMGMVAIGQKATGPNGTGRRGEEGKERSEMQ